MPGRVETVHRIPSTKGAEVVVYDWGGGPDGGGPGPGNDAPVLVFAHATGLHGHLYEPLAAELRATFRCISMDLRGHGSARRPDGGDFDWQGMADDVLTALDAMALTGRTDVHGFGHSMGGCALVRAQILRPDRFCRLFLFEPIIVHAPRPDGFEGPSAAWLANWSLTASLPPDAPGADEPGGPNPMAAAAKRRREVFASRTAALENYRAKLPWSSVDEDALQAYVTHGFVDQPDGSARLACPGTDEASVFMNAMTNTIWRVPEVAIPVTVAAGERSEAMHRERATWLARQFPRGRDVVVAGRTHFGPFEQIPEFAATVREVFAADPPFRGRR